MICHEPPHPHPPTSLFPRTRLRLPWLLPWQRCKCSEVWSGPVLLLLPFKDFHMLSLSSSEFMESAIHRSFSFFYEIMFLFFRNQIFHRIDSKSYIHPLIEFVLSQSLGCCPVAKYRIPQTAKELRNRIYIKNNKSGPFSNNVFLTVV